MKVKNEMEKINAGDVVSVIASDPGFYNDVQSWARVTGNKLVSIESDKGQIKAVIEKSKAESQVSTVTDKSPRGATLIVFDNDFDKVIASFIIANGALSMGKKVTMFFTFWGLNVLRKSKNNTHVKKTFIEKMFGKMMPRGSKKLSLSKMNMLGIGNKMIRGIMKKKNIESLESMIEEAIKSGAELVACQMSMDVMGIKKEELIDGVKIGGVAMYLEATESAGVNLFI
jgi:peroxiredoxin family protein/TusA-related sulfurtransferase